MNFFKIGEDVVKTLLVVLGQSYHPAIKHDDIEQIKNTLRRLDRVIEEQKPSTGEVK